MLKCAHAPYIQLDPNVLQYSSAAIYQNNIYSVTTFILYNLEFDTDLVLDFLSLLFYLFF